MKEEKIELGAVCGRFQVFHKDHLKYVLGAKRCCKHLLVGITSPDPSVSPKENSDENRGLKASNPCTYYERMIIIEQSLIESGIPAEEFHIVPFPIGKPELVKFYVPLYATCFFTIYDQWGQDKMERMQQAGYHAEVLWKSNQKGLSSTFIRKQIAEGKEWKEYVPSAAYDYMKQHQIDKRILKLMS